MIKVKKKVQLSRTTSGRCRIVEPPPTTEAAPAGRVPRVAKLMALAIKFDGLLRKGVVSDQSELSEPALAVRAILMELTARLKD